MAHIQLKKRVRNSECKFTQNQTTLTRTEKGSWVTDWILVNLNEIKKALVLVLKTFYVFSFYGKEIQFKNWKLSFEVCLTEVILYLDKEGPDLHSRIFMN